MDTGIAKGWVPADFLAKSRPPAVVSKAVNPMMSESSFSGFQSSAMFLSRDLFSFYEFLLADGPATYDTAKLGHYFVPGAFTNMLL